MKKILFIYEKPEKEKIIAKKQIHIGWVKECGYKYEVRYWGKGYSDTSYNSLVRIIDSFKPDYIYATMRSSLGCICKTKSFGWLPDLTSIKVPKIFVECDEYKWNRFDPWYNQFDKVLCRQSIWGNTFYSRPKKIIGGRIKINTDSWKNVPLFRWSIPKRELTYKTSKKSGIYFLGAVLRRGYTDRKMMYEQLYAKIKFRKCFGQLYWETLRSAAALICPTESNYGCFVPAKLFEYLASGAAVLTNCDMRSYGISDLEPFVIKYTNLKDLESKLDMNFKNYHNRGLEAMKNHTHEVRYKELFGE